MTNLKPCPFCGSEAILNRDYSGPFIECLNPECPMEKDDFSEEDLIEKWNTRQPQEITRDQLLSYHKIGDYWANFIMKLLDDNDPEYPQHIHPAIKEVYEKYKIKNHKREKDGFLCERYEGDLWHSIVKAVEE